VKVYLSGTYKDLVEYRKAAYQQLRMMRHDVIGMEDYVASDQRPTEKCLADVADSDAYFGIFAWRYGLFRREIILKIDPLLSWSTERRRC